MYCILYCIVFCSALYCIVLYCTVFCSALYCIVFYIVLHYHRVTTPGLTFDLLHKRPQQSALLTSRAFSKVSPFISPHSAKYKRFLPFCALEVKANYQP